MQRAMADALIGEYNQRCLDFYLACFSGDERKARSAMHRLSEMEILTKILCIFFFDNDAFTTKRIFDNGKVEYDLAITSRV